jgi:hypothetical protein
MKQVASTLSSALDALESLDRRPHQRGASSTERPPWRNPSDSAAAASATTANTSASFSSHATSSGTGTAAGEGASPSEPASGGSTAVAIRPETAWDKAWKGVEESGVWQRLLGIKSTVEQSDSAVVNSTRSLLERASESLFSETDQAAALREIKETINPTFTLSGALENVSHLVPLIMHAFLNNDAPILKSHCEEVAYAQLHSIMEARVQGGITFDSRILDMEDVEYFGAAMVNDDPVLLYTYSMQQTHCVKDSRGHILEGAEDEIRQTYYLAVIKPHGPEAPLPYTMQEIGIRGHMVTW